jgi:hypothetical protein
LKWRLVRLKRPDSSSASSTASWYRQGSCKRPPRSALGEKNGIQESNRSVFHHILIGLAVPARALQLSAHLPVSRITDAYKTKTLPCSRPKFFPRHRRRYLHSTRLANVQTQASCGQSHRRTLREAHRRAPSRANA